MASALHYRELAEELRYRACCATRAEVREQLKTAARDYEQLAREADEENAGQEDSREGR